MKSKIIVPLHERMRINKDKEFIREQSQKDRAAYQNKKEQESIKLKSDIHNKKKEVFLNKIREVEILLYARGIAYSMDNKVLEYFRNLGFCINNSQISFPKE